MTNKNLPDIDRLIIPDSVGIKPRRSRAWIAIVTLMVGGSLYYHYYHLGSATSSAQATEAPQISPPSTTAITSSAPSGTLTAGGYLETSPPWPLLVITPIPGNIMTMNLLEGQAVKKGETLLTLDDTPYRHEVAIFEAEAQLAKTRLERARKECGRLEPLVTLGTTARSTLLQASHEATIAQAEVATAEARLERARWQMNSCVIRSPADGIVLDLLVHRGQWVSPTADHLHPSSLLTLTDPQALQAWVDLNQRDLAHVAVGQAVELATDANPSLRIPGRIARLMPKANLQKNSLQVKIAIPAPPAQWRPEMSVTVTFLPQPQKVSP